MDEITQLEIFAKQIQSIQKAFIDYRQASDEQFEMFLRDLIDLKIKIQVKAKNLQDALDEYNNREAKRAEEAIK